MSEQARSTGSMRFDRIEIDVEGHRLLVDGREVPLERKAFAVLVLLAGQAGRVFARDEILDAVWGHAHVTPGVLNRIVTLLRQALGERADAHRYLHTVHGVGYRFDIGDVNAAPPGVTDTAEPAVAAPGAIRDERTAAAPADPRAPASDRRRWLLAVALLVIGALLVWWLRASPPSTEPAASATAPVASVPTLIVMPLATSGNAADDRDLAAGLGDELIDALARIDGLRVIARESSGIAAANAEGIAELIPRFGISHALEGSVRQHGERLRIALRLVDARDGHALWTQTFDREFRDVFATQEEIARAVATALRLKLVPGQAAVRTEDPALYRRFLIARQPYLGNQNLETAAHSEAALRALVEEHPGYARAWGGLAMLQYQRSLRPRSERFELLADAERLAARALALDPQQIEALHVLAGQACREQRWSDCLVQSRRVLELAPAESANRTAHAFALATMGYTDRALALIEEAALIDPASSYVNMVRGRLLDTLGRHDEAKEALLLVEPVRARTARILNALWRRDLADARRLVEARPLQDHWRQSELATIAALEDARQWPAALAEIDISENTPSRDGERVDYNFMRLFLTPRDLERDVAALAGVQRASYATYHLIFWQVGERELRQTPAFHRHVVDSGLLALWHAEGWPPLCRAAEPADFVCD